MIAIQSYYGNKELKVWEKKCWELSYNSILEHTDITDIVVYTNNAKYVPFKAKNVKMLPDTYQSQFDNGWWQIYKQYLYQLVNEPFVHIDIDLILQKNLGNLVGDVICEKKRNNNVFTNIEESLGYVRPLELLCSGIMGKATNHTKFYEIFEKTLTFIENFRGINVLDSYRWSLEEGIIANIATRDNLNIQAFDDSYYKHFQGKIQKMDVNNFEFIEKQYKEKFNK